MLTFTAFYIDVDQKTMANVHKRVSSITVTEPHRFTKTMLASAALFHPGCRKVVLSDRHTPFPFGDGIEVNRFDLDPTQPMISRSMAWLEFLCQADSHIVFLDSDILINANLDHLFAQDFDVALTYRDQRRWPINAGINFVHGDHLEQGRAFHGQWLAHFRKQYAVDGVWGGDQDVLRDLVSEADFTRTDSYLHQQHGYNIFLIPCNAYNFSTDDENGMSGYYPDKKVLHFKGRRKSNMLPYWERYLKQKRAHL